MKILVLNAGSSSHKSALFELSDGERPIEPLDPLWQAQLDWTRQTDAVELKVSTHTGATHTETLTPASRIAGVEAMLRTLWQGETQVLIWLRQIDAVGHRVVHGGQMYQQSVLISDEVEAAIQDLIPLAPAHNPANLEGIEAITNILGDIPQVAVFDTAFHSQMPAAAATYAIPYEWSEKGVRRYGFHGISHQYCVQRAAQLLNKPLADLRLITCHLGNGCSLAAVKQGRSIDTTMGFTPLEGLVMGSRSGSIDPGILLHWLKQRPLEQKAAGKTSSSELLGVTELDRLLNKASGLKGISGVSNDLRQIQAEIAQGNPRAQLALDVFLHSLQRHIGALLPSLGGLDALVFTAGMGENSPAIWQPTCAAFAFLGTKLDPEKLARSPQDQEISAAESAVRVLVIHTREEWAIAQDCWHLMRS